VLVAGLSAQSDPDAMGQPYHGHTGITGARHRAAHRGAARTEAVRTHQTAHLAHHDEEYRSSRSLSTGCHSDTALCRQVLPVFKRTSYITNTDYATDRQTCNNNTCKTKKTK